MKATKGFTLIELLVVIAIIAILAAILFPIFTKAKEKTKVSGCQNNLRQIHIALTAYVDDYDGRFPACGELNDGGIRVRMSDPPPPGQISSILHKYTGKKRELWRCPADMLIPKMSGGIFDVNDPKYSICDYAKFGSSYQWRLGNRAETLTGKTYAEVLGYRPRPSELSIARDAVPFHQSAKDATKDNWHELGSASNVLFLDGHVKLTHGTAFTAGI